jgi:arylsulfatase B/arylsulfatase I/J
VQVRAVDESVKNITDTYRRLGILDDTLIVLSADNGGIPADGGNNYPLRGNKATVFEGGVRGLGFVSGAGLAQEVRGTVSHGLMHVTDW